MSVLQSTAYFENILIELVYLKNRGETCPFHIHIYYDGHIRHFPRHHYHYIYYIIHKHVLVLPKFKGPEQTHTHTYVPMYGIIIKHQSSN